LRFVIIVNILKEI